ncbi:MAG TPA: protein kinase [Oligoflexia bacterium]|nr:protein kinase [Oligoflexia bacterium]HMP49261.1 protein kinase [Oligoflexia bacterium]
MNTKSSCLELWEVFARTPLEMSEAFTIMTSFAFALKDLHSSNELWDHCEKGVLIYESCLVEITGTLSNRHLRLKGSDVDPYRSIAPPEFIISGIHDVRSDIFAWGIISYELITGICPVYGENITEIMNNALRCDFLNPCLLREECPEKLSDLVMKSISKNPDDRFQTTENLIEMINKPL